MVEAPGTVVVGDISKRGGMISRRAEVARLAWELSDVEAEIEKLATEMSQCDQASRELDSRSRKSASRFSRQIRSVPRPMPSGSRHLRSCSVPGARLRCLPEKSKVCSASDRRRRAARRRPRRPPRKSRKKQKEVEALVRELGSQLIVRQHEVSELAEAATKARVAMGQVQEQKSSISRELATARAAVNQIEMELSRCFPAKWKPSPHASRTPRQAIAESEKPSLVQLADKITGIAEVASWPPANRSRIGRSRRVFRHHRRPRRRALGADRATFPPRTRALAGSRTNFPSASRRSLNFHDGRNFRSISTKPMRLTNPPAWIGKPLPRKSMSSRAKSPASATSTSTPSWSSRSSRWQHSPALQAQLADIADAEGRQLEEPLDSCKINLKIHASTIRRQLRGDSPPEFHEMFPPALRRRQGGPHPRKSRTTSSNPASKSWPALAGQGAAVNQPPLRRRKNDDGRRPGHERSSRASPPPFCILDEVDAALDEANTTRFAAIIQDFLSHSQFIVITHNKRTMGVANTLYGVTMQEQGVSKRVAVKFDTKANANVPAVRQHGTSCKVNDE